MTDSIQPILHARVEEQYSSTQMEHRLLRLTADVETLERTMSTLLDLAQTGQDQLSVLVNSAVDPQREAGLNAQLAELSATLQSQQEATDRLDARAGELASGTDMQALLASVVRQEQLAALESRMAKLVRTQFKANTLNESQLQQLAGAQTTIQELAERGQTRQDDHLTREALRLDEARTLGRQELAVDLLPAIDGLELALENGRAWTERQTESLVRAAAQVLETPPETPPEIHPETPPSRWQRMRLAWGNPLPQTAPESATVTAVTTAATVTADAVGDTVDTESIREMIQEVGAWLAGLELVHERFVGLLAADGIQSIDPLGKPFDPHRHVAVDTVESTEMPPNTVAQVTRKGYRQGKRIIRYAEVSVARAPESTEMTR